MSFNPGRRSSSEYLVWIEGFWNVVVSTWRDGKVLEARRELDRTIFGLCGEGLEMEMIDG